MFFVDKFIGLIERIIGPAHSFFGPVLLNKPETILYNLVFKCATLLCLFCSVFYLVLNQDVNIETQIDNIQYISLTVAFFVLVILSIWFVKADNLQKPSINFHVSELNSKQSIIEVLRFSIICIVANVFLYGVISGFVDSSLKLFVLFGIFNSYIYAGLMALSGAYVGVNLYRLIFMRKKGRV